MNARKVRMSVFALWIKEYGVAELATDMNITKTIVRAWARMQCAPSIPTTMRLLKLKAAKELTLDDIYGHLIPKR